MSFALKFMAAFALLTTQGITCNAGGGGGGAGGGSEFEMASGVNVINCSTSFDGGPYGFSYAVYMKPGLQNSGGAWQHMGDVNPLIASNFDACGTVGSNHSALSFSFPSTGEWTVSAVQINYNSLCNSSNGDHVDCDVTQYKERTFTLNAGSPLGKIQVQ